MSEIKVNSIKGVGASAAAITIHNSDGTCSLKASNITNENILINPQFDICQKQTAISSATTTSGTLTADMWYVNASGASYKTSRQNFTVGQTDVPDNPKHYFRLEVTTANNNLYLAQFVEDLTRLGGREVTLSYWVKGTNPAGGSGQVVVVQDFGSGGSTLTSTVVGNVTATSTWTKKSFTFTVPSLTGKTLGSVSNVPDHNTQIRLFQIPSTDTATTAFTLDFANIKLEYGDTATPCFRENYGDTLRKCQRYKYIIHLPNADSYPSSAFVQSSSSGYIYWAPVFPTSMRTHPSYTATATQCNFLSQNSSIYFNWTEFSTYTSPSQHINRTELHGMTLRATVSNASVTDGAGGIIMSREDTGVLEFNAEL